MAVRAKFQLQEIKQVAWGSSDARELKFGAMYDQSIPEDQRYSQATPSGCVTMFVDNPAALAQFQLGKFYYFDITPAQ